MYESMLSDDLPVLFILHPKAHTHLLDRSNFGEAHL
jgi:hypothetical protein